MPELHHLPVLCPRESTIACPFLRALSTPSLPLPATWGEGKYIYLPVESGLSQCIRTGVATLPHFRVPCRGSPVVRSVGQCVMLTLPLSQCQCHLISLSYHSLLPQVPGAYDPSPFPLFRKQTPSTTINAPSPEDVPSCILGNPLRLCSKAHVASCYQTSAGETE